MVSSEPVPAGKGTLAMDFKYDGGGMGKGGTLTLLVNGKTVGEGRVEKTTPYKYALAEGGVYRRRQRLAGRFQKGNHHYPPGMLTSLKGLIWAPMVRHGADVSARCRWFGGKAFVATFIRAL